MSRKRGLVLMLCLPIVAFAFGSAVSAEQTKKAGGGNVKAEVGSGGGSAGASSRCNKDGECRDMNAGTAAKQMKKVSGGQTKSEVGGGGGATGQSTGRRTHKPIR
jgi:hypothetical protein